jgi:hypothetical protein
MRSHALTMRSDALKMRGRGRPYAAGAVAVVVAVVACLTSGCGVRSALLARALQAPRTMRCPDGLPVRVLVSQTCPEGICGWTCASDRWQVGQMKNQPQM